MPISSLIELPSQLGGSIATGAGDSEISNSVDLKNCCYSTMHTPTSIKPASLNFHPTNSNQLVPGRM